MCYHQRFHYVLNSERRWDFIDANRFQFTDLIFFGSINQFMRNIVQVMNFAVVNKAQQFLHHFWVEIRNFYRVFIGFSHVVPQHRVNHWWSSSKNYFVSFNPLAVIRLQFKIWQKLIIEHVFEGIKIISIHCHSNILNESRDRHLWIGEKSFKYTSILIINWNNLHCRKFSIFHQWSVLHIHWTVSYAR